MGLLWDGSQFLYLSCDKDGAERSQREGTGNKKRLYWSGTGITVTIGLFVYVNVQF